MTLDEIAALPIPLLADADDCQIYLWTCNQTLRQGFDLLDVWGFKFLNTITWIKPSGLGNYWINRTQTMLMGYKGKCIFKERFMPNIIEANVQRRHSRKPDQAYDLIERAGFAPRLELFARPPHRPGWSNYGNEADSAVVSLVDVLVP